MVIFTFNAIVAPDFLGISNQINLFQLSIEKIIVALVMTFVIINAEIDLSVGSMMGLSACTFGYLFQMGVPAPLGHPDLPEHRRRGRAVQRLVRRPRWPALALSSPSPR